MVTALILMQVERTRINTVAQGLADIPGISEARCTSLKCSIDAISAIYSAERSASLACAWAHRHCNVMMSKNIFMTPALIRVFITFSFRV